MLFWVTKITYIQYQFFVGANALWCITFKLTFLYMEKTVFILKQSPGGRLNKKDGLTRYGDSHVKDKTS